MVVAQKGMIAYFQRIYIAILCISSPVICLLTRALTGSIKKVGKAARRIAKGNYSERIGIEGKDEICELASDFDRIYSAALFTSSLGSSRRYNISA